MSNLSTLSSRPNSLSSTCSSLLVRLSTEFLIWWIEVLFIKFQFDFFRISMTYTEFLFYILHCVPYFIHMTICILFDYFALIIFTIILWNSLSEISSTSTLLASLIVVNFWRSHVALFCICLVFLHWDLCFWVQVIGCSY
jgi:hypothetical protein